MKEHHHKFGAAVAKASSAIATRVVKSERSATTAWMSGVLLGKEDSNRPKARPLGRDDTFLVNLLRAFAEVDASAETLETTATLGRRAPAKSLKVSSDAQLRLFVESYLNEVYILSLRCVALLTFLQRAYRKDARAREISISIGEIRKGLATSFKALVGVRGAHVHEFRYDDFDVSRLSTLKILATTDGLLARIHRDAIRDVRRKKVARMLANNKSIRELLGRYFDLVYPLVFDRGGKPQCPAPSRTA